LQSTEVVGHDAPVSGSVLDSRRLIFAFVGFIAGVVVANLFGIVGFIALAVALLVGMPLYVAISTRRAAGRSPR